ncbi:MAG: N-6 DNA methylase [Phocaeicola sp.]
MNKKEITTLEENLWKAADGLRANSSLKANEYAAPVLGLIFLRFATLKYNKYKEGIEQTFEAAKGTRNEKCIEEIAVSTCGYYLPTEASYDYLLARPESENIAKCIKEAMELVESHCEELRGCLPKEEYLKLGTPTEDGKGDFSMAKSLLKTLKDIPEDTTGDLFGKVYEYFLGKFALSEGQNGGQFFTPTSVVRLMVEMIEPYGGKILDPACGSGGMFVQSADFVHEQCLAQQTDESNSLCVNGMEKDESTAKLARMNMFLHGLRGEIRIGNSYYDDPFSTYGSYDFVMANPPFNVDEVNLSLVKEQKRFNEYGIPQNKTKKKASEAKAVETVPNGNYLWINLFATSLKEKGRAALVMANSASDARNSERDIRERLIKSGIISGMLSLSKNMFYTVTLPATLWFFDKARTADKRILFIDARNIFRQVDRAHREFTEEQINNIACIRHLYQGDRAHYTQLLANYDAKIDAATQEVEVTQTAYNKALQDIEDFTRANDKKKVTVPLKKALDLATEEKKEAESYLAYLHTQRNWLTDRFPNGVYADVTGLCKAASLEEIEEQDYSLNPGRYVGVVIEEDGLTQEEFFAEMTERHEQLNELHGKANELMSAINENLKKLLGV